MGKPVMLILAIASMTFSTAAVSEGDAQSGREKAFTCMGCHGAPGLRNAYPGYRVPMLGGQHAGYVESALKAYQNGERWHPTMQAHAATMSDQDIADIAAYFASLEN